MALSTKEVQHIAHLARLGLTEKEIEKYAIQLSSILEYVEQLKEVNTEGVEGTAQVTGLENVMRSDEIQAYDPAVMKKIVALAPEHEDNLVKTKSVF